MPATCLRPWLSTLLAAMVVIVLLLALVAQQVEADRREQVLKAHLGEALHQSEALAHLDRFLTGQGIDILKNASGVELLRVARPIPDASGATPQVGVVSPTGVDLGPEFTLRAACVLLDHRNFGYINADDLSDPQVGLRIKCGLSSIDILISLEGSSPTSPHQDVWIEIHDETGKRVHFAGPTCMNDPALQKLAEDLLKK